MNIRVLGCYGGIGEGRRTTSFQLSESILIDAGSGASILSLDEIAKLEHVFLTHAHLDHINTLPSLLDNLIIHAGKSIVVHALEGTVETIREHILNDRVWPDFSKLPDEKHPVVRFKTHKHGDVVRLGRFSIEYVEVNHRGPATAYLVESEGNAFAFSGDTTTNNNLWDRLNRVQNLHTLIIETAFPDSSLGLARASKHYCPSLLAEDLEKLASSPEIYISHLKPGFEDIIMKECREAIRDRNLVKLWQGDMIRVG